MTDKFRKINDTTLAAPRRGRPPVAPEGYEQDPRDPFMFYKKIPDCEYREERVLKRPCCNKIIIWCTLVQCPTSRFACVEKCPRKEQRNED